MFRWCHCGIIPCLPELWMATRTHPGGHEANIWMIRWCFEQQQKMRKTKRVEEATRDFFGLELFKTLNRKWLTSEVSVELSLNNQHVKGNIRICSLTVWHWTNKSKRARSSKHWWWTLRLIRTSLHLSFNFFLHTISQLVSIHTIQLGHTWCNSDQNYWVVLVLGNAASNSIGKTWCYKVKGEQK